MTNFLIREYNLLKYLTFPIFNFAYFNLIISTANYSHSPRLCVSVFIFGNKHHSSEFFVDSNYSNHEY